MTAAADGDVRVADNPAQLRYELHLGDTLAGYLAYRAEPGTLVLVHTDVDPAYLGRGLGSRLIGGALDDIRARGLLLVPLCQFVAAYLRRHPEYADLVVHDPEVSD